MYRYLQHRGRSLVLAALCLLAALALDANHQHAAASPDEPGRPDQVVLTVEDASGGVGLSGAGSVYLSPVVEAEQVFTHMLLRWEASGPVSGTLALAVRSSQDGQGWSDWVPVLNDPHLWVPLDGPDVHWSQVIAAASATPAREARFWQVRALLSARDDGQTPELRRIDVNTVDARFGPSDPAAAVSGELAQGGSVARPPVISRTAWGNPDGQGSRVPPAYYPVSHMVIHHTADPNTFRAGERSWSDRVRAIWSFHTFTRGWGDIGYNYLVTPDGTIYEGRAGGDDAVAFHDTGNYGSMGVALVGIYSSELPTAVAQESLVNLLAWKADQKGIDPLARGYYYGCDISRFCSAPGAVAYTISGHRQINPTTSCPGERAFELLPSFRNRVQEVIDASSIVIRPDDGDLLVDELETSFARSEANWYSDLCGYGGHTFYTFATDNPAESTNTATWQPTIPETGRYRVYAAVPQGCNLSDPISRQAVYRIDHAEGSAERRVDQHTDENWLDLGTYTFAAGTDGKVQLVDLTGEPLSDSRVIFFDSVRWVPVGEDEADVELVSVRYGNGSENGSDTVQVAAGDLLTVTYTIRNRGAQVVFGQAPEATRTPDGSFDPRNGYVYDENECFLGTEDQPYPPYPKETDRFRVTLGPTNRAVTCDGGTGGYPWRWGIDGPLGPGETRTITGFVRFRVPGDVRLNAGLIQEYVRYHRRDFAPTTVTVLPERVPPVAAAYDEFLRPVANVYRLADVPDNLLARTRNALSIQKGSYLGSFAWSGRFIDWEEGGPLASMPALTDGFLIEQTRLFAAPVDGEYTFRTISDDGSWLWVDGQPVVMNTGLHETRDMTGTITLEAGVYPVSFKYFERTGSAAAGYDVRVPGARAYTLVQDSLGLLPRIGSTLLMTPTLSLAADDQGGSGVAAWRFSLNGSVPVEVPGNVLHLGQLVAGTYTLSYQVIDQAGNAAPTQELSFRVSPQQPLEQVYLPLVRTEAEDLPITEPYPRP